MNQKAKVVQSFRDKHTDKIYKVGETLELTQTRIKEILKVGQFIQVEPKPEREKPCPKA